MLRKADDRDHAVRFACQLRERGSGVGEEVLAQQQILRGVAGEGELAEQHELRAGLTGVIEARTDARRVAGDVAHRGIHLAERQPHFASEPIRSALHGGRLALAQRSAAVGARGHLAPRFGAVGR